MTSLRSRSALSDSTRTSASTAKWFGDSGPKASANARGYVFHPSQTMVDEVDGSLTVRFRAAGHLEMAWHLYQWGDAVEVLAPERLRAMVEGHRRSDFDALP